MDRPVPHALAELLKQSGLDTSTYRSARLRVKVGTVWA